jgi:hypothetical protein
MFYIKNETTAGWQDTKIKFSLKINSPYCPIIKMIDTRCSRIKCKSGLSVGREGWEEGRGSITRIWKPNPNPHGWVAKRATFLK